MKIIRRTIQISFSLIRALIIICPFVIVAWAFWRDLVPSGQITYDYQVGQQSAVITPLFPANRLDPADAVGTKKTWQQMIQEPIYFETRIPRKFDKAEVKVKFSNPDKTFMQVGLRTHGELEWNYDFLPLDNPALNSLSWPYLANDEISIWQKNKNYQTIEQFYSSLSSVNNLAVYAYNLNRRYLMSQYKPSTNRKTIVRAIRGNHSFYTYIKNETLDFIFKYNDINRMDGEDPWRIVVYDDKNNEVNKILIADDGKTGRFDGASKILTANLFIKNLPEGVYRIELQAEDDIIFRSIDTAQKYITFINRLYLVDSKEYTDGLVDLKLEPTSVYSTLGRVGFYTAHPAGLQRVGVGDQQIVDLNKTHTDFYITPKKLPTIIYVPVNDIKIFGRGLMALSEDTYFNPEIYNLRDFAETPDIDYLLSSYKPPVQIGPWLENKVVFDLANANTVNRKLRFVISVPELIDDQKRIYIESISVTFKSQEVSFKELMKNGLNYLKNKINK